MDHNNKNHKSSKRSREDREDDKIRSRDLDSDSHRSHRHRKSDKESSRDKESRRHSHHSKSSTVKEDEHYREGSRDRERSGEPFRKSQERYHEEKVNNPRDEGSSPIPEFEGKKKRKNRDEDISERGNEVDNDYRVDNEREKKRERRRFGEKVKKEELDNDRDDPLFGPVIEIPNGTGTYSEIGASVESIGNTSGNVPDSSFTKVSSISNTNENKGVRFHPGNSSTDGASSTAGKPTSLSLDALAKAKKALKMQKELSEKLKKLPQLTKSIAVPEEKLIGKSSSSSSGLPPMTKPNYEVVKRAQELAAKMGFRQDPQFAPLINLFPGQTLPDMSNSLRPKKPPVLRVDSLGREIDEHGNVISVTKPSNLSTLKVNINKQKKESFQIIKPEIDMNPESNPFFDPRMGVNKTKISRPKRTTFEFVEEGKWSKEAEILKIKNQFGEEHVRDMNARNALHAKAKVAPDINPNLIEITERIISKEKLKDPIPLVEWWDAPLLPSLRQYPDDVDSLKVEKLNIYVEHPRPIEPPAEAAPPPPQPLKLTKKEQKKLRTQRRLAREKERQEMIRQGLLEPPKPKVKMSNLMKVLGSEATQDPTRMEMEIRTAAAEREQAHMDRNTARKLTPAEKREKKEKKLFNDKRTMETIVAVYKVSGVGEKKVRFKIDVNAHENRLSGCCVVCEGRGVVVVEGGAKGIKRYGKLMINRIHWGVDDKDGNPNACVLVWQGTVAKPAFHKFYVHDCYSEAGGRKIFADAGVAHYWDLALNFAHDPAA